MLFQVEPDLKLYFVIWSSHGGTPRCTAQRLLIGIVKVNLVNQ